MERHNCAIWFYIIPLYWSGTGSWNPNWSKTRTYLYCRVNIMATQVARASAAMVLDMNAARPSVGTALLNHQNQITSITRRSENNSTLGWPKSEHANIGWAWPFQIVITRHGTLHHATKFQVIMWFHPISQHESCSRLNPIMDKQKLTEHSHFAWQSAS